MNTEQKALSVIENAVILFVYPNYKGHQLKQLYTVDTSKQVKIGGKGEIGYNLKFFPENTLSNTCMTYMNILDTLHKGTKDFDGYAAYYLKNTQVKAHSNVDPVFSDILDSIFPQPKKVIDTAIDELRDSYYMGGVGDIGFRDKLNTLYDMRNNENK